MKIAMGLLCFLGFVGMTIVGCKISYEEGYAHGKAEADTTPVQEDIAELHSLAHYPLIYQQYPHF